MRSALPSDGSLRSYALAILMVGLVIACAGFAQTLLPPASADLLFLIPVLASASLHGMGPGLFAAVLGALAYNFFFTEPVLSLRDYRLSDTVTFLVLLGVAILAGSRTARLRRQAQLAAARSKQDAILASFSRALVGAEDEAALGQAICQEAGRLFGASAALLGPGEPSLHLIASHPPLEHLGSVDAEAAQLAMSLCTSAGRGTTSMSASGWTFYPLATSQGVVGALGLAREDDPEPSAALGEPRLATILDQAALALERRRLADEVADVERLREQDRLRGALLSSVSHDLRTPLTAILAASAQLRREGRSDPDTLDLLDGEARRLDRYVANLLDMVRLEAGALRLRTEPVDLIDAVAGVLRDLGKGFDVADLRVEVPADLPLVRLDPHLFHHCLLNLVDNALRHGGGRGVTIRGLRSAAGLDLVVLDEGPGLPPGQERRIFETFVRLRGSDREGGTGLGLAIVKGFAEAMGLSVEATNRSDQPGAAFVVRIPSALLVESLRVNAE